MKLTLLSITFSGIKRGTSENKIDFISAVDFKWSCLKCGLLDTFSRIIFTLLLSGHVVVYSRCVYR